jgi:hypothetical protein
VVKPGIAYLPAQVDDAGMTLQKALYLASRFLGDANAAQRGTLGKRLIRRQTTRVLGREYDRLWR